MEKSATRKYVSLGKDRTGTQDGLLREKECFVNDAVSECLYCDKHYGHLTRMAPSPRGYRPGTSRSQRASGVVSDHYGPVSRNSGDAVYRHNKQVVAYE